MAVQGSIGARLDRLPVCRFHRRMLALIGSGLLLDSIDIYLQGPLLAYFLSIDFSNLKHNADFLSATFLGLVAGTLLSGRLTDRMGRRSMFQVNLLLFGICSIVAGFASSMQDLIFIRFFIGVGLGGEVVVTYGTLAEFVPPHARGIWQGKLAFLSNLGIPLSALLCAAFLPSVGWRPLLVSVGLIALGAWAFQRRMPESPRWYEAVGRQQKAEATMTCIEHEVESCTNLPLPPVPSLELTQPICRLGVRELFGNKLLHRTLLATFLMIAVNVNVYTFTAWLPTILLERTNAMNRSLLITWIIQLGALPGALIGSWASERFGRKESIVAVSLAAAALTFIFGSASSVVALAAEGFLMSVLAYGLVAITFAIYIPELFPTSVRMTGSSFANACGRGANIVVPQLVAWMLPHGGSVTVFIFLSVLLVTQALVMWIFGLDTRFRSLEQI